MSKSYVAFIADAIASRELSPATRARLQADVRAAVKDLNHRYRRVLAARFAVTLGDELQCLLPTPQPVWDLAHDVRARLPAVDWVVACGRGPIPTPLAPTASEMDGRCFHEARAAMDRAKRQRQVFAFGGFGSALEPLASYYSALYWSWTPRQRRTATLLPAQVDGRRRGRALLFGEALFVIAALVLGKLLEPLARPSVDGLWWGRVALLATAYLYVSGRGIVLIRSVLELPTLQMRRDEDRTAGAIDVARGRAVGSLERALALTMVLLGDYAAVGWIIAAKSLARFKQLEDREFAEYFLVGTLASFLLAVLVGVGIRILLKQA